ncbi:hypothetical protein MIR68_005644 [Amoeboaphelidium protococcarum]|nr:hypothetical protein MIR68_005644 [Amoeboaphelidium protococcarum]
MPDWLSSGRLGKWNRVGFVMGSPMTPSCNSWLKFFLIRRDGKPNVVHIYNAAMPGVGKNDQMKFGRKTARRLRKKYQFIIYHHLFDVTLVNAYIYHTKVFQFAHMYQELLEMLQ